MWLAFVVVGFAIALSVIWSYVEYAAHVNRVKQSLPLGPKPLPWLGTRWAIRGINTRAGETFEALAHYGDLVTLWIARCPMLIINSPKAAHDLLHLMSSDTSDRPLTVHYRAMLSPWSLVLAPHGNQFQRLRKIYHSILSKQGSAIFETYSHEESLYLLKGLLEEPDRAHFECDRFGFNVTMRAIYGERYGQGEDSVVRHTFLLWEKMFCCFFPGSLIFDYFPCMLDFPKWLQPWLWVFKSMKGQERGLHTRHLADIRYKMRQGEFSKEKLGRPFAVELLQTTDGTKLPEQAIIDILSMLFGAGADTISAFMQQFLKTAAVNPAAVHKARAEIDAVVGSGRLPTWSDRTNLPYVRSLIKEVHRWAPFADAGIPHATTEEIKYAGYVIPKGTILMPNIPAIMRSPLRYTSPNNFDPERFMENKLDSAASAHSQEYMNRDHVHFGWGRRLCPGTYAADICLFTAVARIIWAFTIEPRTGESIDMGTVSRGLLKKPLPFTLQIALRGSTYQEVILRGLVTS